MVSVFGIAYIVALLGVLAVGFGVSAYQASCEPH